MGRLRLRWRPISVGTRAVGGLVILTVDAGGCHGARRPTPRGRGPQRPGAGPTQGCVAALRRITALPTALMLDTVVLACGIHAQAAGRRQHAATAHRRAATAAQREDEAAAQHHSEAAAQREGVAAAERHHTLQQARIERRYPPSFDEGDVLRPGITTPTGEALWLDAYESSTSETEDRNRLEAAYWLTPLPLTDCSAWSAPGRRSACRKSRPTSSFRTWRSVRLRPSHCGTPPRILKRNPLRTVSPLLATPAAADSRLTKGQGDPASWVACHRPTLVQDISDAPFRLSDHRPRRGLSPNATVDPRTCCWCCSGLWRYLCSVSSWRQCDERVRRATAASAADPSTRKPPAARRDGPAGADPTEASGVDALIDVGG